MLTVINKICIYFQRSYFCCSIWIH